MSFGDSRRNRTSCLSTQLFEVRFRRPMPGARTVCTRQKARSSRQEPADLRNVLPAAAAIYLLIWCPRKDLNLHPLVCRTSAPPVELLGLASEGSKQWQLPAASQSRSVCQLPLPSASHHWRLELESNQPLEGFSLALIHLSYPTDEISN